MNPIFTNIKINYNKPELCKQPASLHVLQTAMLATSMAYDRKRNNGRTASIDTVGKLGDESNVTCKRARNLKVLI